VGDFESPPDGFILQNGTYKTLPNSALPTDINKFGTMVSGNAIVYKNGATRSVKAASSYLNESNVNGINDAGIVNGMANFQRCHANNTLSPESVHCEPPVGSRRSRRPRLSGRTKLGSCPLLRHFCANNYSFRPLLLHKPRL